MAVGFGGERVEILAEGQEAFEQLAIGWFEGVHT